MVSLVGRAGATVIALSSLLSSGHAWSQDAADVPPPPPVVQQPLPPPVPRPPPVPQQALDLHDEARALYAKGKYAEAIERLTEAVALDPEGRELHYNLGLIHEKLGDLDAALRAFKTCLSLERDPSERMKLQRIIKRLEGARRYKLFERSPSGAVVRSPRVIEIKRGVSPWVWVTGGVALASFGVAAALAARASAVDPGDQAMTGGGVSLQDLQDDADTAHSLAIGADVLLAVGAAASVATLTIAIVSAEADIESVGLRIGPGHVSWRF